MRCSRNKFVKLSIIEFSVTVFDAFLLMRINNAYVTGSYVTNSRTELISLTQQIMTSIAIAQILDTVCDLKMEFNIQKIVRA